MSTLFIEENLSLRRHCRFDLYFVPQVRVMSNLAFSLP